MRRGLKEKLSSVFDDPRRSSTTQSLNNNSERRHLTDRFVDIVKDKGDALVSAVQEHITSMTDTTGALAKQKLLQTLFSSGLVRSEDIRKALQIGIGYFLSRPYENAYGLSTYILREKFPASGGVIPPHSLADFDFEAYELDTFHKLLNIYGINADSLRQQICDGELKEIVNPSSSGSLLYLTSNSTYLIKTARDYDAKFIQQKFLHAYYEHIKQTPGTFIAKLCGLYGYIPYISQQIGITVDSFTLRFVIFSNIIPANIDIHEKYDVKGSSYKRDANFSERIKSSVTFKDNDFRDLHPQGLKIPNNIYRHLKEVLTRDVEFLEKLNIMDYSLLLIIHNMDNPIPPKRSGSLEALMGGIHDAMLSCMLEQRNESDNSNTIESRSSLRMRKPNETLGFIYEEIPTFDVEYAKEYGGIPAINEKGEHLLVFFGIIDILQTFDICKVMQRHYQTVENPDVVKERSIVDAVFYAKRFKEFVFNRVFLPAGDESLTDSTYLTPYHQHTSYEPSTCTMPSVYPSLHDFYQ
ncbi:unnamed protein product [Rotaria magnacalcarata]|uniref:PIPK domain-containing protein n=1 Tax=Rotaria magnacalcarata TaxID=392030 RepID=A0A819BF35_9BILA|nr:unnamed protein product [Rotaria magnacalcarata]CAF3801095.1 unnamed protein product [Rotaria magnacalcarata]